MAKHVTACDVRATCQTICTIMRHSHKFTTIRKRIILIHSETTAHSVKEANVAVSKSLIECNMTFPLKVTRISRDNVYIHKPHTDTIFHHVSVTCWPLLWTSSLPPALKSASWWLWPWCCGLWPSLCEHLRFNHYKSLCQHSEEAFHLYNIQWLLQLCRHYLHELAVSMQS